MTDLHSHILPGIDDGAPDIQTAMKLVELEYGQGVRNIALTSHYSCEHTELETFLRQRESAFRRLRERTEESWPELRFKLGSEVFYSPKLMQMDVRPLCLEGTTILLLELSTRYRPQFFREALNHFQAEGIIPLIAHVERYPYVMDDPGILADWVEAEAYAQVNAGTLLRGGRQRQMAVNLLKWGLVHVIASDTHSPDKRPPQLKEAMGEVQSLLGGEKAAWLGRNADALFAGREPEPADIHRPRRFLGRWI